MGGSPYNLQSFPTAEEISAGFLGAWQPGGVSSFMLKVKGELGDGDKEYSRGRGFASLH